ncbi:hypothetical protein [Coleofasciculus sp. E1-EBD-02]|uniref:hypothetical protein n=1 Tax=Coleofasciculus sp. E1-EBD-02 TaxID=3068481 RepID=UPI0032F17F86
MTTFTINNLPDDLYAQIQQLATQNNQSVINQVIELLKQALQSYKTPEFKDSLPETDVTWEARCKIVPQLIADIEYRRQTLPTDIAWLDSTALIRADRDSR